MRKLTIVGVLLLVLVLTGMTACNPMGSEGEATNELVEVERGDLMVTVSGSGNIDVYEEMSLTFGIGGRIEEILVEEGDEVEEGDVLARLETDALELAVTQAQVAVTKAQTDITQVEVALKTAEYNLEQTQSTYSLEDIKAAEADIVVAKRDLDEVLWTLSKYDEGTPGWEAYQKILIFAQARVNAAEDKLDAILMGTDSEEVAIKKLQVELAAQSVELANQSLVLAEKSLEQSRKQLDNTTITAPFTGIVAAVNAKEKDTVTTMNPIVYLIDPSRMELKVDVDEIDVADVKLGQKAIIEVDALPDLELEGEVSFISQLPKEEGGVIVYEVKVRFDVGDGSGLKDGMSASTDIVVKERTGVLLVPSRAVKRNSDGDTVVEVSMVGGENQERVVTVGISDGFQTEIISGLEEGEVVVGR